MNLNDIYMFVNNYFYQPELCANGIICLVQCGIVHTNNLSWKLLGASGGLTLYKPFVTNDQWSSARVKLLNNDESIEAGWMVRMIAI